MPISINLLQLLPKDLKVVYVICKLNDDGEEVYYESYNGEWLTDYLPATHYVQDPLKAMSSIWVKHNKAYTRLLIKQA